jgi:hypothetical protein
MAHSDIESVLFAEAQNIKYSDFYDYGQGVKKLC